MAFIETIPEDAAEGATIALATGAVDALDPLDAEIVRFATLVATDAYRALDPELRAALTVGRPIEGG
jgi:hypothetical protein